MSYIIIYLFVESPLKIEQKNVTVHISSYGLHL
jgi:hypothetical protein